MILFAQDIIPFYGTMYAGLIIGFLFDFNRVIKKNFNVWCYSGYTLDELVERKDPDTMECLNEIDVLVDGRFKQDLKDPNLKFRGSSNQRIVDVKQSLKTHQCVEIKL